MLASSPRWIAATSSGYAHLHLYKGRPLATASDFRPANDTAHTTLGAKFISGDSPRIRSKKSSSTFGEERELPASALERSEATVLAAVCIPSESESLEVKGRVQVKAGLGGEREGVCGERLNLAGEFTVERHLQGLDVVVQSDLASRDVVQYWNILRVLR